MLIIIPRRIISESKLVRDNETTRLPPWGEAAFILVVIFLYVLFIKTEMKIIYFFFDVKSKMVIY